VQRCQCGLLSGLVLTILRRDRAASCGRRSALSSQVAVHGDSEIFMLVLNVDEGDTSRLFTDDVMASSETVGLLGNVLVHNLLVELDAIHPDIAYRVIKQHVSKFEGRSRTEPSGLDRSAQAEPRCPRYRLICFWRGCSLWFGHALAVGRQSRLL
jgi:hypothetical protein